MLQERIKQFKQIPLIEKIGVSLSLACAVHCVVSPIFIALLPLVSSKVFHNPAMEIILVGTSFLIVGITNLVGFLKHHKKYAPLAIMLLGFSLIASGHVTHNFTIEIIGSIIGGLLIATSIIMNTKAKKQVSKNEACCSHH